MTTAATDKPVDDVRRRRGAVDVAVLIAVVPIAAAAVRIWLYSGGNSELFLVLLRTLNIPAALIGTTILLLPTLLSVCMIVLLTDGTSRDRLKSWRQSNPRLWNVLLLALTIIVVYTFNWITLASEAFVLGVIVVFFALRRAWRRHHADTNNASFWSSNQPDSLATIAVIAAGFLITPNNMWLPLERVGVDHHGMQTAYVLESTDDWTTLLTKDRRLEIIPSSQVNSRIACASPNPGTLAMLMQQSVLHGVANCG